MSKSRIADVLHNLLGPEKKVITIDTPQLFNEIIGQNNLTVIKFFADWCPPCKVIAPKFQKIATSTPNIAFAQVNIDTEKMSDILDHYRISSVPTFIVFLDGKPINSCSTYSIEKVIKMIDSAKREHSNIL